MLLEIHIVLIYCFQCNNFIAFKCFVNNRHKMMLMMLRIIKITTVNSGNNDCQKICTMAIVITNIHEINKKIAVA